MMSISMEQIDEMRKRTNCSYQEAKELLEKYDGDLIDAIIAFEKMHGNKSNSSFNQKTCPKEQSFGKKVKALIQKGCVTRFIIEKDQNIILNIPIIILIVAVLITMPIIGLYVAAFILLYVMGYRIRIRKEKGQDVNINEFVDGIGSKVRTAADKMREKPAAEQENSPQAEAGPKNEDKKEDGYNEITIG
ncbi:MAG: DUF4342 domain-containing protein [Dehalobacter sp.]|uniref:Elongation factor Ts n=2 Tax=Desulfitobacteriaceae TaxID=2937909 RepID=A0ABM5P8H6_DEHRP|nr:elongation factor Ts [Dehalobacter restrictus DSM 9455]MCG1024759.1 DUF4342 domain-containing protein [Dehalobacter sp.]OCZ49746.1 elongation factor Ts [Dehalobacter sp. TeCB1]